MVRGERGAGMAQPPAERADGCLELTGIRLEAEVAHNVRLGRAAYQVFESSGYKLGRNKDTCWQ